jgi:uncharacterized protein YecA (UPF0149 family)
MHKGTGIIIEPWIMERLKEVEANGGETIRRLKQDYIEMEIPPTTEQLKRGRVLRNDPCPCGSGKKFKKCCYRKS